MLEFPLKKLRIINYLIIALIFLAALLFTRNIIGVALSKKGDVKVNADDNLTANSSPAEKNIMSYAPIVEKNPFGPPMEFQPLSAVRRADKKQGSLSNLLLFGTVTGPEDLSYAIFTDISQPAPVRQEVFAYGEDVYAYGTLTKIEKEWVELTQGVNTHRIPFTDIKDTYPKSFRANDFSPSRSQFARKINEKQYLLNQKKVEQALRNPEKILSDARLFPNIKDGKQEGFRISEVKPGGIYQNLGLRNRDVLLRINGLDLSTPEAAMQAMSALKGMNTINLDIIRNGSKMTLGYQIR
ncbi:MAG: type II secretion system protein GspC [Thermodesulfovibrionia bacterium]|nr:MAG: type II secretion system protein GspC [Thermodesulfovibrionia bacterium]